MITTTPPIGILIDLPFGFLMWTSFVHFLLIIVMNEDSGFALLRLLRGLNAPIYAAISLIKPAFIISRLLPLYAAGIPCWRTNRGTVRKCAGGCRAAARCVFGDHRIRL